MKKTLVILFFICILPFRGFSQIVDTVDIMKEFDEFSFRDAKVTGEVKDSTRIREHFIGVKWGMSVNNISFSIDSKFFRFVPRSLQIFSRTARIAINETEKSIFAVFTATS